MSANIICILIAIVVYLVGMIAIGVYYSKGQSDAHEFYLGGRKLGPIVTALSTEASDMSAWLLMGVPGLAFFYGIAEASWTAIGLALGTYLNWLFVAKRLRQYTKTAGDAITLPQFFKNRFHDESGWISVIAAVFILVFFLFYTASGFVSCAKLFSSVFGIPYMVSLLVGAVVVISYTFAGGFFAVCWTDFYQGLMILGSLLIAPIFAVSLINPQAVAGIPPDYWNPVPKTSDIISGFGWGLGYFGMPHIIIRFMSLKSQKEMKKSAVIAISWTALICFFATMVGVVGRMYLGMDENINQNSLVFIAMVRSIFPALMSGILLSGVLAASMSTASSQLLASASAFASDVYKPVIRKYQSGDKEMLWAGRIVVLVISFVALLIADSPRAGSIMELVANAWGVFGASFGSAIMLSLFWRGFTFQGAVACIIVGAVVDIGWYLTMAASTGIYEIIPGFFASLVAGVIVSLLSGGPSKDVAELYDKANNYVEE